MTALIWLASIAGYLFVAGFVYAKAEARGWDTHDSPAAFLTAGFWPLALPILLGNWFARAPQRSQLAAAESERLRKAMEANQPLMEARELGYDEPLPPMTYYADPDSSYQPGR